MYLTSIIYLTTLLPVSALDDTLLFVSLLQINKSKTRVGRIAAIAADCKSAAQWASLVRVQSDAPKFYPITIRFKCAGI